MTKPLRLIVFDVDGTLVDSQADIVASMTAAFQGAGLAVPDRAAILSIVGLSLDVAIPQLAPGQSGETYHSMVEAYKTAYMRLRASQGTQQSSPLYPGIRAVLDGLHTVPEYILGVATGKSRRGLDALLAGHGMERLFLTQQVADHHPSKPHPAMLMAALAETGIGADQAVMIGDTEFDMSMARAAGMRAIGVSWGYHMVDRLVGADVLVHRTGDLPQAIVGLWE
jgi:phosphoglycolate phosphatase